jgi:hypothetical protein
MGDQRSGGRPYRTPPVPRRSDAPGDTQTFVEGGRPSAGLASRASDAGAGGRVGRPQLHQETFRSARAYGSLGRAAISHRE